MANTKNYNLKKPEQAEFYNVNDFNDNMDIIDTELKKKYDANNKPSASDVGALPTDGVGGVHNIRTYTALAQIGVTIGEETLETISAKMPSGSVLAYEVGSNYNLSIYPVTGGGTFYAQKTYSDRLRVEFIQYNSNKKWIGFVYGVSSSMTFTGWEQVFTKNNKPTASEVGAVPELLGNSNNDRVIFLLGDHRRLTNHVDADVPNLPIESNYSHMYTIREGKVQTCLSIPNDYGYDAYYYTAYDKTWRKFADASKVVSKSEAITDISLPAYADKSTSIITIKGDGTTSTSVAIATSAMVHTVKGELNQNIESKAKIATGEYTGDGNAGQTNARVIPIGFTPKLVIITSSGPDESQGIWVYNSECMMTTYKLGGTAFMNTSPINSNGNNFSWWNTTAETMLNRSTILYKWIAIG